MKLERFFIAQERVGKDRKPIVIRKIRTMNGHMRHDPPLAHARLAGDVPDKDRITLLGSLLRYSSLDEIPQILNFLRGEMQLIGIRPKPLEEFETLPPDVKEFYASQKPGLFPGDAIAGCPNGNIEETMEYMRAYMWEAGLRKQLHENNHRFLEGTLIASQLARIAYHRVKDTRQMSVVLEKINEKIRVILSGGFA